MDNITEDRFYEHPDLGILVNLGFCLVIGVPLFGAFCFLRKRIFRLYDANLVYRDRSKFPGLKNGTFSWISPTLWLPDKHLLLLTGLDGFVYLKSLKLMLIIMIFFGFTGLLILWPTYYFSHWSSSNYYVRSCIRNIKAEAYLWIPLMVIVACTWFIFYSIYLFFRNFVVYRQAYLKSPSTFQALNKIETYTGRLRSYNECIRFFDVLNRSIILTGVSSTYTPERIKSMFEDMRLGDVQSIFIAKDRSEIIQMLKRLNQVHEKLETLYNKLFNKLLKKAKEEHPDIEAELDKISQTFLSLSQAAKLRAVVDNPTFYPHLRQQWTVKGSSGAEEKADALKYLSAKLDVANEELNDAVHHFIHDTDSGSLDPIPFSPHNSFTEDPEAFDAHSDLVSFRAMSRVRHNVTDFKLTMWGTSSSAVIVFADWKSATIASQALLSARPFSFAVEAAPMVTEVDWDNLHMPRADRTLRNLLGDVLYIVINVFFTIFVAMFASLLDLDVLERVLPFLGPLLKQFPKLRELIMGILGPLSLNIILALIPYLLLVLTYYQAYVDKADVQLAIMNKYSWLLFIQTFIVSLAGPVQEIIKAVFEQNYGPLLELLDKKAALTSAIFLNLTLQKALIGLILVLAKPADIILALIRRVIVRETTPRAKRELNKPTSLPLGFLYPEYAVIVFQMCLSFSFITPLITIAGILFFGLAYFIFRAQLIFSDKIPHETGGIYWPSMSTHILFALVMAQFFTLIQFISLRGRVQAFLLVPVMILTVLGMILIRRRFRRRVTYLALCGEAQEAAHRLIREQNELRDQVIDRAYLEPGNSSQTSLLSAADLEVQKTVRTFDTYVVLQKEAEGFTEPDDIHAEAMSQESQQDLVENPYINPVLLRRYRTLMLPRHFFALIQWLQEHPLKDQDDEHIV